MNSPRLSAIMIVKNEEKNLLRCLKSLQSVCDEICVVDTGSTDRTVDIAKEHGARVSHFSWNGNESDARNASARMATGRWVFTVDADEEISTELARELKEKLPKTDADESVQSLSVIWRNHYRDHSTSLTRITRISRNFSGFSFWGNIHPVANYRAPTLPLEGFLDHYGYIWTPEQKKKKSAHMLEHLAPLVQGEKPELGRLSQYITYLLVSEREEEFRQRLAQVQTYSPQERTAELYWRQTLANILPHFSEKDDFETGKFFAEEILQAHPSFVAACFYLLQNAVRNRAWQDVIPLAQKTIEGLEKPVETANIIFPNIQKPAAQAWLWLACALSSQTPPPCHSRSGGNPENTIPSSLIQSQTLPVILYAQEKLDFYCSNEPFAKLLRLWKNLQQNSELPEWNLSKILEAVKDFQTKSGAEHLLASLIHLQVLYRTKKVEEALPILNQLLQRYADHRWLAKIFASPEQPDWRFYENSSHQV